MVVIWSALVSIAFLFGPSDDGFVPVDPQSLNTISSKTLLIAAYAAIFIILIIYSTTLLVREKALKREIERQKNDV